MDDYWKSYWTSHLKKTICEDPFQQVGRTLCGESMPEAMFLDSAERAFRLLDLEEDHDVLDLCCGNGLYTLGLAEHCRRVVGIDFNQQLAHELRNRAIANISVEVSNAIDAEIAPDSFDGVLFAAALQHFTQAEAVQLFAKIGGWLKPGGVLLVTDIPDESQMWSFYDSPERENKYFRNLKEETPILGTWFQRTWLEKLAEFAGFSAIESLDQPESYWYSHYRFDLLCRKA